MHAVGTDLAAIKAQLAGAVRSSIAAAAPIEERRGIVDWDLGDLPNVVETSDRALDVRAYPALLDVGESVSLRVVTTPELQRRVMHGGVRRLLLLTAAPGRSAIERLVPNRDRLHATPALIDDCIAAAIDDVMRHHGALPWTRADFDDLRAAVRREAPGLAGGALTRAVAVERAAAEASALLAKLHADALRPSVDDANAHLGRLVRPGFVLASGIDRLDDIERYVRAITYRLEHLAGGAERDRRRMQEVVPLEQRYTQLVDSLGAGNAPPGLADLAWQLEEFRVATFAQPLVVKRPGQPSVEREAHHRRVGRECWRGERHRRVAADVDPEPLRQRRQPGVRGGGAQRRRPPELHRGSGRDGRTVRADAGPRVDRRAHRRDRSRRTLAVPDGPHRRRAGQPGRVGGGSVRRRGARHRQRPGGLGAWCGRHAQPHRVDGGDVPRPRPVGLPADRRPDLLRRRRRGGRQRARRAVDGRPSSRTRSAPPTRSPRAAGCTARRAARPTSG